MLWRQSIREAVYLGAMFNTYEVSRGSPEQFFQGLDVRLDSHAEMSASNTVNTLTGSHTDTWTGATVCVSV